METTETLQGRLQQFLQRFDKLADHVGPLDSPHPDSEEVAALLLSSAEQCGIAAGIFDMAENIGITLTSKTSPVSRHNLENPHRRGRMVVVPGFGDEDFRFPDVNTLVNRALARLGNGNQEDKSQGDDQPEAEEPMLLILGATKLGEIMRVPPQASPDEPAPKTATKDLLFGHSTAPQVCFMPDADTPPTAEDGGVLVVEFIVQSQGSLPDALHDAGEEFLTRAEQLLTAAEAICPDRLPPGGSAEVIPVVEKQSAACSS